MSSSESFADYLSVVPKCLSYVCTRFSQDSKATNKNALSDPYIKAIRWGLDRIGEEGVMAFVTNNSFLGGVAFDGMRKHLADDPEYIVKLIGKVITVSLETVNIINQLPALTK